MILAYWCVLVAAFMPLLWVGVAKFFGRDKMGLASNHNPREWLEERTGVQKRAYWAQLNSFEAFPPFAAGVFVAVLAHGSVAAINVFAAAFVVLRLIYGVCYIADRASLRSLVWTAATICTVVLFVLPVL